MSAQDPSLLSILGPGKKGHASGMVSLGTYILATLVFLVASALKRLIQHFDME